MSQRFGSAMLRMGAKTGDVLAMVLPNMPEFPIAFLGACGAGLALSPMNPTYTPGLKEIIFIECCKNAKFDVIFGV